MDSVDTTDDIGWNLMHQTNDEISIEENSKATQHDPYVKNSDVGDNEENLEAPHYPIISVNVANKDNRICQIKNVLGGYTRSRPHSSFPLSDINCPKQLIIFNCCDKVDLQNLKRGQELYKYPSGTNINQMLLIGQLM